MKIKILITLISFLTLIIKAQHVNDEETFIKKMNIYRQSIGLKELEKSRNVNNALDYLLLNNQILIQNQINYDTLKYYLRRRGIWDYQIKLVINNNIPIELNNDILAALNDPDYNIVGSKSIENKSYTLFIKSVVHVISYQDDSLSYHRFNMITNESSSYYHGCNLGLKTSLPIVKYDLSDNLNDINKGKNFISLIPKNNNFTIKNISSKYLVIINSNNQIVFIYENTILQ